MNWVNKKNLILILIISIVFKIGGLFFIWAINNNQEIESQALINQLIIKETEELKKIEEIDEKINDKNHEFVLDAKAAISVLITPEENSQILFKKNTDERLLIASLTKLMTAYVILEYYNLFHIIEISEQAVLQLGDAGKLKAGQKLSVKDLLFPLLITSCNDAAFALSETISKDHFVFLMNLKAEQLGLKNTYFVNPSGLDEEKISSYSTVNDLVKFTEHLLNFDKDNKGELLWDILSTKEINLYGQTLINTNQLLDKIPGIVGGRTGWTSKAGGSLLIILQTPEGYLINIILGAPTPKSRFEEMKKLINWTKSQKTVNREQ